MVLPMKAGLRLPTGLHSSGRFAGGRNQVPMQTAAVVTTYNLVLPFLATTSLHRWALTCILDTLEVKYDDLAWYSFCDTSNLLFGYVVLLAGLSELHIQRNLATLCQSHLGTHVFLLQMLGTKNFYIPAHTSGTGGTTSRRYFHLLDWR
jgi:hypothetical protein